MENSCIKVSPFVFPLKLFLLSSHVVNKPDLFHKCNFNKAPETYITLIITIPHKNTAINRYSW